MEQEDASGPECAECGTLNLEGAKFCKSCGEKIATKPTSPIAPPPMVEAATTAVSEAKVSQPQQVVAAASVGSQLWQRLKKAKSDPTALLDPVGQTKGRFSFLEILGVVIVCGLFILLYAAGWNLWGANMMLRSGAPVFLAFVIGLMVALKTFRSLLDKPLMPVYQRLSQFSPRMRILAGLLVPMVLAYLNSEDRNMGFESAGLTITMATLLGHVLVRSTAFKGKKA